MDNLSELTYEPDETTKTWHFYNGNGDAIMVLTINYKDGHTDKNLERLIKLHARGFRVKHINEED